MTSVSGLAARLAKLEGVNSPRVRVLVTKFCPDGGELTGFTQVFGGTGERIEIERLPGESDESFADRAFAVSGAMILSEIRS